MRHVVRSSCGTALLVVLGACGGGGSTTTAPGPVAVATPAPAPTPTPDPRAPVLLSPAAGATVDNGCREDSGVGCHTLRWPAHNDVAEWSFDWTDVPGATRYHLYVMGPSQRIIDTEAITSSQFLFNNGGYIADNNTKGCRWRVRAELNGSWGPWSEERLFDVEPVNADCPAVRQVVATETVSALEPLPGRGVYMMERCVDFGTIDATLDWGSTANDMDLYITYPTCNSSDDLVGGHCHVLARTRYSTVKPEHLGYENRLSERLRFWVVNRGPGTDWARIEVGLTH